MHNIRSQTRRLANMGLMLAMITALSFLEHMLPPITTIPGIKPGLSNIITMYALFFLGRRPALLLAVLKSLFVMLTRGATAGFLSLSGGLLSIAVIIVLMVIGRGKISYLILSVTGAIFHNLGQFIVASFLLKTNLVFASLPFLIISGVVMGCVTGMLLRVVMPLFHGVWRGIDKR